jgi:hypothetical protein
MSTRPKGGWETPNNFAYRMKQSPDAKPRGGWETEADFRARMDAGARMNSTPLVDCDKRTVMLAAAVVGGTAAIVVERILARSGHGF